MKAGSYISLALAAQNTSRIRFGTERQTAAPRSAPVRAHAIAPMKLDLGQSGIDMIEPTSPTWPQVLKRIIDQCERGTVEQSV